MNLARAAAACAAIIALCCPPAAADTQALNAKAAFLFNLARFTEWPERTFADAASPVVLGVAGDELLRWRIDHRFRGKSSAGRPVEARSVEKPADLAGIHVLYIGRALTRRTADLLSTVNGTPVLTVSEAVRFCEQGGMVEFLVEHDRVQFEVSVDAATRAGLKVSSHVLRLSRSLHGTP